ncbi:hypothetical protein ACPA0F_18525 [Solibacillus silvestris]
MENISAESTQQNVSAVKQEEKVSIWGFNVIGSFLVAAIFMFMGFYKMFVYESGGEDYFDDESVNAYVGGDAYNFIINGTYTTAYFVLTLAFMVLGCTFLIVNAIRSKGASA